MSEVLGRGGKGRNPSNSNPPPEMGHNKNHTSYNTNRKLPSGSFTAFKASHQARHRANLPSSKSRWNKTMSRAALQTRGSTDGPTTTWPETKSRDRDCGLRSGSGNKWSASSKRPSNNTWIRVLTRVFRSVTRIFEGVLENIVTRGNYWTLQCI